MAQLVPPLLRAALASARLAPRRDYKSATDGRFTLEHGPDCAFVGRFNSRQAWALLREISGR